MFLMSAVGGMLGGTLGGTAAAGTAATAGAAAGGFSLSSILQGVATVGGLVASIASGNAEAASLKAQAADVNQEKTLENLQSADRRRGLLASAMDTVGQIDTAYAASGSDLSFGSAVAAKQAVFRSADLGLTSDSATTALQLDRMDAKQRALRTAAKQARTMGWLQGLTSTAKNLYSMSQQA
jgi:hypothetical protein